MAEPRWTERADEVVHDILANYVYAEAETVDGESAPDRYAHEDATADARHDATREVLAALADAGLLLPPGGETREVRGRGVSTSGTVRTVTTWPDGSVHTGPWREVGEADHG